MSDDWIASKVCTVEDTGIFYPDDKGLYPHKDEAVGKCIRCPVQAQCLDYSLLTEEWIGVWGGFTDRPRRAMFRKNNPIDIMGLFGEQIRNFVEVHFDAEGALL